MINNAQLIALALTPVELAIIMRVREAAEHSTISVFKQNGVPVRIEVTDSMLLRGALVGNYIAKAINSQHE
ncbi:MAG: hypothetical protein WC052_05340 [Patescibacteria group bacterium]